MARHSFDNYKSIIKESFILNFHSEKTNKGRKIVTFLLQKGIEDRKFKSIQQNQTHFTDNSNTIGY